MNGFDNRKIFACLAMIMAVGGNAVASTWQFTSPSDSAQVAGGDASGRQAFPSRQIWGSIFDRAGTNNRCVKLKATSWPDTPYYTVAGSRTCVGNAGTTYNTTLPVGVPCLYEEGSGRERCFIWKQIN